MLSSVFLNHQHNSSIVNKINPVIKILSLIMFTILVMMSDYIGFLLLAFVFLLIALISKLPIKIFLKQIWAMKFLYIFLILFYYLNDMLFFEGVLMIGRIILIIMYSSILTLTTKPLAITEGIEKILSPLKLVKINVKNIALTLSLAINFIPLILDQIERILKALKARGMDYQKGNLKDKLQIIGYLLLPTFVLSLNKADRTAEAMEVRLFEERNKNYYSDTKINMWDYTYLLIHIFLVIIVVG